jgi:hypothetical protein
MNTMTNKNIYRLAVGLGVFSGLALMWINLAVGIIGNEDNPPNLLYVGVIAVGLIGAIIYRHSPAGLSRALFATAFVQALVPVIALLIWRPEINPGVLGVFILNTVFVAMFVSSGLQFRRAAALA